MPKLGIHMDMGLVKVGMSWGEPGWGGAGRGWSPVWGLQSTEDADTP